MFSSNPHCGHQKAISICHLKLRGSVGLMRRITPLTLVALMLLQTLAMGIGAPVSAADARGQGDASDFRVVSISLGKSVTMLGTISLGIASAGTFSVITIGPVPSSNAPSPPLDPSPITFATLTQV